ncbi:MAG TPA: hypothetical protein PKD05_00420, partial [Candidatus Melainabacteria bacterium]|nr:hypothetical protein [Candidatus Melainabacteria bacterium]
MTVKAIFPTKISLGNLYFAEERFPHQRNWLGEAAGEFSMEIPPGKMLGLALSGQVEEEMLEELAGPMSILSSLDLSTVRYSAKFISTISQLERIKELRLDFTPFEDNHVQYLKSLPELSTLWLLFTAISNKGIKNLSALPSLTHLVLKNTEITDAGLSHLREFKSLKTL